MATTEPLDDAEKVALGLPINVPAERVVVAGKEFGALWCRYSVELTGCLFAGRFDERPALTGPVSPRGWPPDPPTIEVFGRVLPMPRLELVRIIVRHERTGARVEWRWEPGTANESISDPGNVGSRRRTQAAKMGRQLVDEVGRPGRPFRPFGKGTSADEFENLLERGLSTFRAERRARILTIEVLARHIAMDRSALRDNLDVRCIEWKRDIVSGKWLRDRTAALEKE